MVAVRGSGGGVRQRVCVCVRILEDGVQKVEVRGAFFVLLRLGLEAI